jgi:DNA-binding NtrC family response regulator
MTGQGRGGNVAGHAQRSRLGYRVRQMVRTRKTSKTAKRPAGGPRTYGRLQRALDDAARREIEAALSETSGNVSEAARVLGIGRPRLWERMKALGISSGR